jgi:hypothetical protein
MPLPPRPLLQEAVFKVLGLPLPPHGNASPQAGWGDQSGSREGQPRALSAKSPGLPAHRLLSRNEVTNALRHFKYNQEYRGRRRVPIKVLGDFCGLSRDTLHTSLMTGEMSQRTQRLLSSAIIAITEGRLRFRRHGQVWQAEGEGVIKMLDDRRWRRSVARSPVDRKSAP